MIQKFLQQETVTRMFSLFIFILALLYVVSIYKKTS